MTDNGFALQNLTFNSIFNNLSYNLVNCVVTLHSVGVAFDSISRNTTVVVKENQNATIVQNLSTQNLTVRGTTYWSGYQFNYANSYDVQAQWSIPSTALPDSNHCANGLNYECDLAIWTGESTSYGGGSGFAQGGSDSIITCYWVPRFGWNCGSSNDIWYEFPPAGSVICSTAPSVGDNILGEMSWSSNTEKVYVYDTTNGNICSSTQSESTEPSWQQFIAEFPTWVACYGLCSGFYYLPKFNTYTVYEAEVNYIPISRLSNPYPAYMTNGPGGEYNIILSSIFNQKSIGSFFSEEWQTSSGT